jgi:hypothetical protein
MSKHRSLSTKIAKIRKSKGKFIAPKATTSQNPPHLLLQMQGQIGNQAVSKLIQENQAGSHNTTPQMLIQRVQLGSIIQAQPATESAPSQKQSVVKIDDVPMSNLANMSGWYALRLLTLLSQQNELKQNKITPPESLQLAIELGKQYFDECVANPEASIDTLSAIKAQSWLDYKYIKAMNEAEAQKARVASERMRQVAQSLAAAEKHLHDVIIPALRDRQRETFRKGDENKLLAIADTIMTALDTSLIVTGSITAIHEEISALSIIAGTPKSSGGLLSANSKVPGILECAEKINKVYAGFQLVRAGLDLVSGHKTANDKGKAGVKAMSTLISAGGTILGASAGMTLYSNLYIGPMVDACLERISTLENIVSKGQNLPSIEMGQFDWVNWNIEPGGRPVFDFMLTVMRASDSSGVPKPIPKMVADFFLENKDEFKAGVGGKDELPTKGLIWKSLNESEIAWWVFHHRQNIWGMLYGSTKVPK